jgi:hypothetical protein
MLQEPVAHSPPLLHRRILLSHAGASRLFPASASRLRLTPTALVAWTWSQAAVQQQASDCPLEAAAFHGEQGEDGGGVKQFMVKLKVLLLLNQVLGQRHRLLLLLCLTACLFHLPIYGHVYIYLHQIYSIYIKYIVYMYMVDQVIFLTQW